MKYMTVIALVPVTFTDREIRAMIVEKIHSRPSAA